MAEQWIDAAATRELVMTSPMDREAVESLCDRAAAGLVASKVRLLVATRNNKESRAEDIRIEPKFWAAVRKAPFKNNWAKSDFSAFVTPHERWQAFGVSFGLGGLLEMLPSEQRAPTARRFSVAGNPAWMPARLASSLVVRAPGIINARTSILEQARLGFVSGRAVLAQRFEHRRSTEPKWEEREWDVPDWFWAASSRLDEVWQKWDLGTFSAEVPASAGSGWMTLSGVNFLAESLQVLLGEPEDALKPNAAPTEAPARSKSGGRVASAFWEDMLCDVWALIYQGDFEPKVQADVERAMRDWAIEHGQDPGESTIRLRASKVFLAYSKEAKNFIQP